MGPVPAPTPTGEKRRYAYNILKQEQRPLAPSTTENVDVENGSPKPQPTTKTQNTTRFKQDPPKFTALASAEQGAAQTSEQMMAQGPCSLENRITIPLQTKAQQQQQVTGPHLGTFIQAERDRPIFSASHTMKERERELQARQQQLHEVREREAQQHQDREGHTHHRHRVSQQENERPPQPYQHAPNLVSNSLHSSLLGQPPSAAQSGVANTPAIEVKYDERTRIFIQSQQRQQQQQQEQQKKQQAAQQQAQQQQAAQQQAAQKHQQQQQQQQHQQAQQQQQRQSGQQTPIQQLLQRSAPIDTSMRRVGPGLFSNTANQLKQSQSPASASQPAPPMSPRGETIRPSSVPVQTMPQQQPPPPVAPPKKSSIMDILNNDSEPPPRKRLSDQPRPAAPTPPSQAPSYQPAGQPMQQIPRRETPLEPLSHLQQQQQQLQLQLQRSILDQLQQQRQSQLREPTRNWAAAAQQLPQQQPSWMEERTSQASAISPPPPQSSFLPPSSRSAFQPLQRNHVPSPPPFPHSGHSRTSSYTSTVAPSHHHSRQQSGLPSTPAEPNIRPSPYASLNPHQQTQQPQQQQQLQMQINQRLALEKQQREAMETEHDYRVRHQREDVLRRTQEHDRLELMKRIQEQEEYERRVGRGGGADYRGLGRGL